MNVQKIINLSYNALMDDLKKNWTWLLRTSNNRVKSGNFGHQVNSATLFVSYFKDWNKKKITKQTVKILMRRLIKSRLIWVSTFCKCMSKLI